MIPPLSVNPELNVSCDDFLAPIWDVLSAITVVRWYPYLVCFESSWPQEEISSLFIEHKYCRNSKIEGKDPDRQRYFPNISATFCMKHFVFNAYLVIYSKWSFYKKKNSQKNSFLKNHLMDFLQTWCTYSLICCPQFTQTIFWN